MTGGWGAPPAQPPAPRPGQPGRRQEAAFEDTASMGAVPPPAGPGQPGPAHMGPGHPGQGQPTRIGRPPGGPVGPGGNLPYPQGPKPVAPTGGFPRPAEGESTQMMGAGSGGRRRRGGPPQPLPGGGPGGPGGPKGPDDFDDDDDEPRRRTGWRRFVPSWKIVVTGVTVVVAGVFGMIAIAYANTPVPDKNDAQAEALAQGSTVYYADGKTPIAHLGTKRVIVDISKISDTLQDAVIAIENDTFREDSGISIPAMFRSVWMTATGQQLQGASTITQQMARNYYDGLSQDVSVKRKVMEIFVAVKINKTMEKDEILEQYLNTINFGRAYGVEAAAQAYFGKKMTAAKLDVNQAAYLAARVQTPSWSADEPALQSRFKDVVNAMARLDPAKYGNLPQTAKFPKTIKDPNLNEMGGLKGYMVSVALHELKQRGIKEDAIQSGGYKIVTTFDPKLMKAAQRVVKSVMASVPNTREVHTSLAAVDPTNGRVIAFYGGDDYVKDNWNEPFDSAKQAASAFKPYVLAAWLEAGYSLNSWLPGNVTVPKEIPGQAKGGFTNDHGGPAAVNAITATSASVNTAYVSMAYKLDEDSGTIGKLSSVRDIVVEAGFSEKRMDADIKRGTYQFSIGSAQVTAVEQAAGYSIFANAGKHVNYHVIKGVYQGKQLRYPERKPVKQVISPEASADAVVALEEVLKSGTAGGQGIGRPAGGKTGTNNEEKEAWFVGFTPQVSTAVGMYREECRTKSGKVVPPVNARCPWWKGKSPENGDPKFTMTNPYSTPFEVSLGFAGASFPTRIWREFMLEAHKNKPVAQFPPKAGIGAPEDIVPSPTPTPKPEDEIVEEPTLPWEDDGGGPGESECFPGAPECEVDIPDGGGEVPFDPFSSPATPAQQPAPPASSGRRS